MENNKIGLLIILGVLTGMLSGCLGGGSSGGGSGISSTEIRVSALGVEISDLSATLEIAGMDDTYPMTVNTDDTVSATVEGLASGLRSFTVTYYANDVVLARATRIIDVVSGQNMSVIFTSEEIDRNFDDDFDGWVNLAEVLWGSEPLLATSSPPSEDPRFVLASLGTPIDSTSYTFQGTLGEAVSSGSSTSLNYALESGFQAY